MADQAPPDKPASSGRGKAAADTIKRAEIQRRAIALRRAGHTFEEIAAQLGLANRGVAKRHVDRGLARWMQAAGSDELRAEELDRSEAIIARLWPLIDRPDPDLGAVDRLVRLLDYRAKITGLYAPVKRQVDVDVRAGAGDRKVVAAEVLVTLARDALPPAEEPAVDD
jgi:hypothetical protein